MMENCIVLSCVIIGLLAAEGPQEIVLVQDINSDHDRRHLDAGLPSTLKFDIKRESGTVQLTLEENERLNANAPVYEVLGISEEERKLVQQDSVPITNVRFYQDKGKPGAFTVRCKMAVDGPCIRYLIGNLYIGERNYDIEPVPEIESKRGLNVEGFGTPHFLAENGRAHNFHQDMIRGLKIADFVETTDIERPLVDNKINLEEDLDIIDETESNRQKRETELFAVEIFVVLDYSVWIKYYETTSATKKLNRTEATKLKLREHYSHIINGVSLRYESIDDPKLSIYCTISGFLILKKRDGTNPFPPGSEVIQNGREYAEANDYLYSLVRWAKTLKEPPHKDHIMTFTLYDLYSGSVDKNSVEGVAYMEGICGPYRVSLNEEEDIFSTISVAAHELGHNLGADHDKKSDPCDLHGDFLMAPYVALFNESSKYSVRPWRFSECSINAFKNFFDRLGSKNCLTDPGDYYNHKEYVQHNRKLPGELHDATAQCKLLLGEKSRLCTSQNRNKICMVMKCLTPRGTCRYFAAARGTSCGDVGSQKWCIDGACTHKDFYVKPDIYFEATTSSTTSTTVLAFSTTSSTTEIISTTESTLPTYWTTESSTLSKRSVMSTTTFKSTNPKCVDIGLFDNTYTCSEIQGYYASVIEFCNLWEVECCDTCKRRVPCTDHGYYGYSCETILEWYEFYIDTFCEDFGTMCCATCKAGGMTTFYTTTTVASTTPIGTELFQCNGDVGYDGLTCKQLEMIHGNKYEMCTFYTAECCRTCAGRCKGNKGIQLSGALYPCEDVLLYIFVNYINAFCRAFGRHCCDICT